MTTASKTTQNNLKYLPEDDYLWRQLKSIPAFRALLRAVETRFYQPIELPEPILDLGCGDGHFSEMTFDKRIDVGIDPWWGPLQKSKRSDMYDSLVHGLGDDMPFPDESFGSVFSNSVLEHIPDIQTVLNETSRVLKQDGTLMITMPSHYFNQYLKGVSFFKQMGADGLAAWYSKMADFVTRHEHTDSPDVWAERLAQAGFEVERWQYYFSKEATQALEWGHVQGLPSAIIHAITGHWIIAPWRSSLHRTEKWLRPFYEEPFDPDEGAYLLIVARKKANHPIDVPLPPARPFSLEELEQTQTSNNQQSTANEQLSVDELFPIDAEIASVRSPQPIGETETARPREGVGAVSASKSNLFPYAMVLLSLITAVIGQTRIGSNPEVPSQGIGWFLFAAIPLLILGWQYHIFPFPQFPSLRLPKLGTIPAKRWLILLGILFSFLANRFAATVGSERPFFAFLAWFFAIATAIYALHEETTVAEAEDTSPTATPHSPPAHTRTLTILVFFAAFIVRIINLSNHPFILNGIEASLGLDALRVVDGFLRNPFATGWLSNPTLPTFLAAIPLKLLGPTTFAIRLWSPIVGAATVAALFWIGQRLYGRTVGVVAAILLAGSHFHLHYSRLGMHNIWDALLALLALGCIGIAWESATRHKWLLAGGLIGLNAYFFTSSRLLPIMLATLFVWAILFNRDGLRKNGFHIFAAALMALVVALPQMLFYQNNLTIFMERANALGIFADQTNWLAQEAARRGATTNVILKGQIWRGLFAFNGGLDNSPAYRPLVPLLSFGPALFFVLGLITAVYRIKQLKYVMLIVWFGVTAVFAGAFLLDVPNSHRLIIVAPTLSLLAAIAMEVYGRFVLAVLPNDLGKRFQKQLLPTLLILATLFVIGDLFFYYGRFPIEHSYGDRNTEIADGVAHYLSAIDNGTEDTPQWTAYFYGPPAMYTDFPTIPFLVQNFHRNRTLFDVEQGQTLPNAHTDKLIFIFLPERAAEIEAVQATYPNGKLETFSGYYADPLYHVYQVIP